jgi:hypothetical protein
MSTGLTFGTISALFGLQHHIIDQTKYTVLVTVVILSAFIPTLIAERFFRPALNRMQNWTHYRSIAPKKITKKQQTKTEE